MARMMTRNSVAFLMGAVAVGALTGLWLSRSTPQAVRMETAAASPGQSASSRVVGPARIEPLSGEIDLAADVAGVLASIPVKAGDRVKQGQLLAEFVNQDAQARLAQASAALQMQTARLNRLKKGPRKEERQQAVAAIQEQDATLNRLNRDLARQKLLFAQGYTSKAQLEQAQSAQGVAAARQKSSAEALAQMDAGPRAEDLASAEAEVALAKAQLGEAQAALDKTRIRAPMDGVILRVDKHPGEAVGLLTSSTVAQMGNLDRIVARAQIDDADIARLRKGDRAYVTAPAYAGQQFGGVVSDISPRLGAKTIQTGAPTEKRDASVLDVLVTLDKGADLPIGLRVDCFITNQKSTK